MYFTPDGLYWGVKYSFTNIVDLIDKTKKHGIVWNLWTLHFGSFAPQFYQLLCSVWHCIPLPGSSLPCVFCNVSGDLCPCNCVMCMHWGAYIIYIFYIHTVRTHMHACIHVCMHASMHARMHSCMCAYIHTYIGPTSLQAYIVLHTYKQFHCHMRGFSNSYTYRWQRYS